MSKQVDKLMALARQWVEARTKGQGGSSQQDALRQALEAALKPVEPVTDEENERFSRDVSNFKGADPEATKYALKRFLRNRAAPPAQTPPPRLTDDEVIEIAKLGWWKSDSDITSDGLDIARAIETAVRAKFGVQE